VPLIVALGQAAYAFAPAWFGILREWAPDPAFVYIAAAFVQILAIASFAAARRTAGRAMV